MSRKKYSHPYAFTTAALDKVKVWIIDAREHRLQCQACGVRWWPVLGYFGRLSDDYWLCPNECNTVAKPEVPDGVTEAVREPEAEELFEQYHTDNDQRSDFRGDTPKECFQT